MKREIYIDNIKVFACILVVLGHLINSMVEAGYMTAGRLYATNMEVLYSFHVNLFFMCSGYLYQKYTKIDSIRAYKNHILGKLKSLAIPYIVFSSITVFLKHLASGSVNREASGYFYTLFVKPASPYWYLYALLIMLIVIPQIRNSWMAIALPTLSVVMLVSYWNYFNSTIEAVYYFMNYSCWFVLGMMMAWGNIARFINKKTAIPVLVILGGLIAYLLYGWYTIGLYFSYIRQVFSLLMCLEMMILFVLIFKGRKQPAVLRFMSKYTLPIFLMHTIFASGVRMVLGKIHIISLTVHLVLGMFASVFGPIVLWKAWEIVKKLPSKELTK